VSKQEIEWQGTVQISQLREESRKENFRQQLYHKMLKERTWDTMEVQQMAINGLNSNTIVENFCIRKRSEKELKM